MAQRTALRPTLTFKRLRTVRSFWPVLVALVATQIGFATALAADTTVLGINGSRFTVNGRPAFLLGISYYGGLGASDETIRRDLDDIERHGFNWLRVWATWESFGRDVSAVDVSGRPRQPQMDRLAFLIAECDRRGLIVDVTLARGQEAAKEPSIGRLIDFAAHERAVETLVTAFKPHRNWYLDLANERDVRDARYVSVDELKSLRELVRQLDPSRLVTASFGGHDLQEQDVREAVQLARLDFLCPHRPRHPQSPGQTDAHTRQTLALARQLGRIVPIEYQEPFRRGYTDWEPTAEDFLADLGGAVQGGAAGWCFHNGIQKDDPQKRPRRSFDLTQTRLFEQLDAIERQVVQRAAAVVHAADSKNASPRDK